MKYILAKIKNNKKYKLIIIALIFAVPFFIISKYLTLVNNDVDINVRKPNYTVIFHSNDGSGNTTSQDFVYGTNQQLYPNAFSYLEHIFGDWNTLPNGAGTSYGDGQSVGNLSGVDGDTIDLYAQWKSDFSVTGNPSEWTNQNVVLTIVLPSGNYNDYSYSFDGGATWTNSHTAEFSSNQEVHIKIRDHDSYVSEEKIERITKIDKVVPEITFDNSVEYNSDHTTKSVPTLIAFLGDNASISTGVNITDSLSGVAAGWPVCYYDGSQITTTNVFDEAGRYEISCKAQDNAGNEVTEDREVLIRWPLGGRYVVARQGYVAEGHSSSTSADGLYKDTSDTGHNSALPFSSKYYYAGADVNNYVSFVGTTFRILNIATNDDIKLLGDVSDVGTAWGDNKIYSSNVYNTWSTEWWPGGQIYNNETGESKYKVLSDTEKAHVDLATFYAGRIDKNDDLTDLIFNEQNNATNLGGDSAAFEGYSAYPNASDFLKASKAHDVINSIDDIDTASVQSRRTLFTNNSWIDMTKEYWTMNGGTETLLQDSDFWVIDNDLGGHFESRLYSNSQQYRVVLYLKDDTILSGIGTYDDPFVVEEDWAWFDSYQYVEVCAANAICYDSNADDVAGTMNDQTVVSSTGTMLISPNYSRSGYGFAGWNTAADGEGTSYGPNQTISTGDLSVQGLRLYAMWVPSSGDLQSWKGCDGLSSGDIIALTDNRDGNTYAVAKYGDNQCWMMENLRLDLSDSDLEISGLNTNSPTAGFVSSINNGHPVSTNTFCNGTNAGCMNQILHNTNNTNRGLTPSYDANNTSSSWYSYGNYYNWYTLTAGHGTYELSTAGAIADGDICPAGWRLPSGYSRTGDYAVLDIAMGGSGWNKTEGTDDAIAESMRWRSFPYNFIYGGEQKENSAANRGLSASYATLNASSNQRTINFWLKNDRAFMNSNATLKNRGQTMRCVADKGYKAIGNIHYDANGGTGTMADAIDVDLSVATTANNGFVKPYNTFISWNTRADGGGIVVAEGGSVATAASNMGVSDGGTLTLYAIWQPHYSLTYNGNGADAGSMISADVPELETGDLALVTSNYSRSGYGFAGWSLDSSAGTKLANGDSVTVYGPNETITVNRAFLNNADSTNNITLYAVWLPENSTKTMQTFGSADCNAMNIGDTTALKDVRDNNVYTVAKLEDGKCWMSENLRLDLSAATISSSNTNLPTSAFVTGVSSSVSSDTLCYADDSSCDDQIVYNTSAINRNYTASYNSNEVRTSWYSYGVMYNWYTATAGNGNYAMTSGSVTGDICPAGWRLPIGGSGGEFAVLVNTSVKPRASYYDSGIVKFPANFNYSGDYSKTKPGGRHSYGRYWSATANSKKAYRLGFSTADVTPAKAWNKWVGFPVRCIVK